MEEDEQGWLQLDVDSGELKTKAALDREKVEELTIKIVAYETGENPEPNLKHNTFVLRITGSVRLSQYL